MYLEGYTLLPPLIDSGLPLALASCAPTTIATLRHAPTLDCLLVPIMRPPARLAVECTVHRTLPSRQSASSSSLSLYLHCLARLKKVLCVLLWPAYFQLPERPSRAAPHQYRLYVAPRRAPPTRPPHSLSSCYRTPTNFGALRRFFRRRVRLDPHDMSAIV